MKGVKGYWKVGRGLQESRQSALAVGNQEPQPLQWGPSLSTGVPWQREGALLSKRENVNGFPNHRTNSQASQPSGPQLEFCPLTNDCYDM